MADYIQKTLAPNERILMRGKWPGIYWFGAWMVLLFLGVFVVGIVWFLYLVIKMGTTRWAITDHRVVVKRGWITRNTHELAVDGIETANVQQSLWGRLFNYGRIVMTGAGDSTLVLPPTADPIRFRRVLETARSPEPAHMPLKPARVRA